MSSSLRKLIEGVEHLSAINLGRAAAQMNSEANRPDDLRTDGAQYARSLGMKADATVTLWRCRWHSPFLLGLSNRQIVMSNADGLNKRDRVPTAELT